MHEEAIKKSDWRYLLKAGVLAGGVTTYLAVIGMIEVFSEREVILDLITLGTILLVAASVIGGYVVATRLKYQRATPVEIVAGGTLTGLVSAVPLVLLVLLAQVVDLRQMFVNITPALIEILTFGQDSLALGLVQLAGVLTLCGLGGAVVGLLPEILRRALIIAVLVTLIAGLMGELLSQVLGQFLERDTIRLMFRSGTMLAVTAVAVFIAAFLIAIAWGTQGKTLKSRYTRMSEPRQKRTRQGGFTLLGIVLLLLPWVLGTYLSEVMSNVGLYILMGLGLNIAIGWAGLLDLGYVTNFAVGAYVMGMLTSTGPLGMEAKAGIDIFNFWLVIPISILAAMFTGFVLALPVLRMRGDYLAITTLGFGEIIRLLALSDWLKPYIGGAQGILFIPKPTIFGYELGGPEQIYYVIFAGCLLMLFVALRLNNSRTGRQWMAMREDEDVAASMGIDVTKTKLLAFTLSAASGGLAGAIFASKLGTIFPQSFGLLVSINVLSLIIVGGIGSIPGVVVGALALIGLPELLREFAEFRLLIYGALLIIMMLVRPEGLWPSAITRREMYGDDEPPAAPPSGPPAEQQDAVAVGG